MVASGKSAGHMQDTRLLHGHSVAMMCMYKNGNTDVIVTNECANCLAVSPMALGQTLDDAVKCDAHP